MEDGKIKHLICDVVVPDNMVPGVLTSFLIPQIIPVLSETV